MRANPSCYVIHDLHNRTGRLDAHFFDPRYFETMETLRNIASREGMVLLPLSKILIDSSANLTGGATPRGAVYLSEGIPFIRVQNVKENRLEIERAVLIEKRIHEGELRRSKLKPNDIVLTITGSYGIAAVVPSDIGKANINQHSVKMEINTDIIDVHYLCHFLNSTFCRTQLDRFATGSTRPALSYPAIRVLEILFPKDLDKQEEIAKEVDGIYEQAYEKLRRRDELLSKIDESIETKLGIELPNEYAEKCFVRSIENGANRLDALSRAPYLYELLQTIRKVPHETLSNLVSFMEKEAPPFSDYYRLVDLRNIEERTGRLRIVEVDNLGSGKILLHEGFTCISCLNPEKGKTIFIDKELDECVASSEFAPVKLSSNKIIQDYLSVILRSKLITDQWKYKVTGSTPSRERISDEELKRTLILVPEKSVQKEIAGTVLGIINKATILEQEFQQDIISAKRVFLDHITNISE